MPFWSAKSQKKAKDMVCGMDVDPQKAVAIYDYQGKTYHFCSVACKGSFAKEPEKYLKRGPFGGHGSMSGEQHCH